MQRKLARSGSLIRCGDVTVNLAQFNRVYAIVFGKASIAMAEGLMEVLAPDFHPEGILAAPTRPPRALPGFRTFLCGHPVPNEDSFAAGRAILNLLATCDEQIEDGEIGRAHV